MSVGAGGGVGVGHNQLSAPSPPDSSSPVSMSSSPVPPNLVPAGGHHVGGASTTDGHTQLDSHHVVCHQDMMSTAPDDYSAVGGTPNIHFHHLPAGK